jgi:nucleoside-diphosphate-sugar epimerase
MGWQHEVSLSDGLSRTYEWFLLNQRNIRET